MSDKGKIDVSKELSNTLHHRDQPAPESENPIPGTSRFPDPRKRDKDFDVPQQASTASAEDGATHPCTQDGCVRHYEPCRCAEDGASDLRAIQKALSLFVSVIKCREPWTDTCEHHHRDAREALVRISQQLTDLGGGK